MWNPLMADPLARLSRDVARLGMRLGAMEHAVARLAEQDRARFRPELARLDEDLWRIDLQVVARGADPEVLRTRLAVLSADGADLEALVERCAPPPTTPVIPLRSRARRAHPSAA